MQTMYKVARSMLRSDEDTADAEQDTLLSCWEKMGQLKVFPDLSVEDQGIVVTARQSIVDNYYGYLAFKVEGYTKGKGREPGFNGLSVKVDGKDVSCTYGMYDHEEEVVEEDGSFEYQIMLYGDGERGSLKEDRKSTRLNSSHIH